MFPRGARFPQEKIPDVPGPGTYNPQDPEFDAYKHGAFLEKTNRFAENKPSDIPGPGTYNLDIHSDTHRMNGKNHRKVSTSDRYSVLQKKVEELERIHSDSKKTFQSEVERLKLDLSSTNKVAAEQTERAEKLKKQNEALESRIEDLKKTSASEQTEARELRIKLRAAEHERAQLAAKQNDMGEVKKAVQAADARRRDELRERDRKIAELERAFDLEKKKRGMAEAKVLEVRGKVDSQVHDARDAASELRLRLEESRAETEKTKVSFMALKASTADTEENLLEQLNQHQTLLSRVAEEYGRLASTTVSSAVYERTRRDLDTAQLRVNRLERKLGNVEDQVTELANLVRYTEETNSFLARRLRESEEETVFYAHELRDAIEGDQEDWLRGDLVSVHALERALTTIREESLRHAGAANGVISADLKLWNKLHRLQKDSLLLHSSILLKGMDDTQLQLSHVEAQNAQLATAAQVAQAAHTDAQVQLAEMTASLAMASAEKDALKKQLEEAKSHARAELGRVENLLKKEKEGNQRLAGAVQRSKQAEDGLRVEIEQLSADLTQAERYMEAYNNLVEEVGGLVDRNALAEDEAERLRKFNAEILGHNNPAQRIMYVDRIRRELYETKQKLMTMMRDKDTVLADNEELRNELALYTSVAVPQEIKPRTAVTRVGRVPLAPHNTNIDENVFQSKAIGTSLNVGASVTKSTREGGLAPEYLPSLPEWQYSQDEMTLDEIM